MDINFANALFPRHCFIAKLFLFFCFFFLPDLVSRDYCKIYSSDFHNFLLFFQFIPFKKDEGLNFSLFSKIEENNLFSSLSRVPRNHVFSDAGKMSRDVDIPFECFNCGR